MKAISAITINQQYVSPPLMPTMEEVKAEMQAHSREETTKLIEFHASGQYTGTDGTCYQLTAEYAEDATKIVPTVLVTITDEHGTISRHHIDLTKIDTSCATPVEMFALCSHADTRRGIQGVSHYGI